MAETDWAAAVQLEQCRTAKISALMQAIMAVPVFHWAPGELEFFLKRMDLLVQQVHTNPMDEASNNYILGYFYSRIGIEVLTDIGVACDTAWEEVKRILREKYGGAARSIPRLILREVLVTRDRSESASSYAKNVLKGFRKVSNRIKDGYENKEEARIRVQMLEEQASETLSCNLPRRIKHWVKVEKPTTLEQLVKTVEEEEAEEREERWEEPRRRTRRPAMRERSADERWRRVERRGREQPARWNMRSGPRRETRREQPDAPVRPTRKLEGPRARHSGCWECGEGGHFARECPYMFRRAKPRTLPNWRGEPMEINAVEARPRYYSTETDSDSGSSVSRNYAQDWRRKRERQRARREEWPELPKKDKERETARETANE